MQFASLRRLVCAPLFALPLFSLLGFLVMGYHPGFEDDGLYLTAVKSHLNPALYPHDADFFRLKMQITLFDKLLAGFVRLTGISVAWSELIWQFAAIALIVFGCLSIARKLFPEARAQWAGVALVTAMFTLPVAGTALYLVDQHLHPRALATGLILLAVSRMLGGKKWQAFPLLLLAFLIHPLMAAMGISFCFFLSFTAAEGVYPWLHSWSKPKLAYMAAAPVPLGWVFEPPTPTWSTAINARRFFFLFRWEWYEWLGALAPLLLFWLLWRVTRRRGETLLARFALAVFLYGAFQQVVAIVFLGPPSFIRLAPLEPMRYLHLVYVFLALVGGCLLGRYLLKASVWRWAVYLIVINAGMYIAQRPLFASTEHLELPGRSSANQWLQAFAWIRQNTPIDAYFALDPDYMPVQGEDYHSFRALAERSQLVDNIKDGSMVIEVPELGDVWARQVQAQRGWSHFQLGDFERLKAEFGVNWVLVSFPPPSGLGCRWHNDSLSVCQIP
jgi:hypothetical protein